MSRTRRPSIVRFIPYVVGITRGPVAHPHRQQQRIWMRLSPPYLMEAEHDFYWPPPAPYELSRQHIWTPRDNSKCLSNAMQTLEQLVNTIVDTKAVQT